MSDDSTTTDTDATTDDTTTTDKATDTSTTDTAAQQVDKDDDQKDTTDWKSEARKHETRAKDNNAKLTAVLNALGIDANGKSTPQAIAQQASEAAQSATTRAEAAERRAALAEAAITHGLSKDDLALLEDVPADKIEDRAKALAARLKTAGPSGASGTEVNGGGGPRKPASLEAAIAGHYTK